ncbi:MAG: hypothetical protein AB1689_01195 [Thermodesulfobacteriota bacterium]
MTTCGFGDFAALRNRVQAEMMRRLPDHLARLHLDAEQIARRQRDGLRSLLRQAIARSPFHARRLAGVDPERIDLTDLPRLPVMTKSELMHEFDDVLTDRRLSRALCERALAATRDEPRPLFGEYTCLASGGSSGLRGVFVLDADAMIEFLSSLNRRTMERLVAQGGPPPGGVQIALVAAASAVHATGSAPAWTAGGAVRIVGVPVTSPFDAIVARLEELRPQVLYGYPSMLVCLARERAAGRLRVAPEAIVATSETLLPEWRATIEEAFGVPVSNTFGSSEGLVGVSAPGDPAIESTPTSASSSWSTRRIVRCRPGCRRRRSSSPTSRTASSRSFATRSRTASSACRTLRITDTCARWSRGGATTCCAGEPPRCIRSSSAP